MASAARFITAWQSINFLPLKYLAQGIKHSSCGTTEFCVCCNYCFAGFQMKSLKVTFVILALLIVLAGFSISSSFLLHFSNLNKHSVIKNLVESSIDSSRNFQNFTIIIEGLFRIRKRQGQGQGQR